MQQALRRKKHEETAAEEAAAEEPAEEPEAEEENEVRLRLASSDE